MSTLISTVSSMRIIELNAGTLRPAGGQAIWSADHLVCRCLVVDTGPDIVLVDTGIGLADIADPISRLGQPWLDLAQPDLDPEETVLRQLPAHGIDPSDISHIVLTHQHRDHVGGLADFRNAKVHLLASAKAAVLAGGADERLAGVGAQWKHGPRWADDPSTADLWHGFETFTLAGLPSTIRLVPLPGHASGHAGVLLTRDGQFVLHIGDAAFHPTQYAGGAVPPGIEQFAATTEWDPKSRQTTEAALGEIYTNGWATIISSHGPDGLTPPNQ